MFRITLIIFSVLIFSQLIINQQISTYLCYYYLAINVITLSVYAFDKSAARKGHWRIKELHLHLLSLLGGWGGALIAQQFIRHKSIKKPFLVVFSCTMIINIILLITLIVR